MTPNEEALENALLPSRPDIDAAKRLIDAEPSLVHMRRPGGNSTPLHIACDSYEFEFAKWLVDRGADVNVVDGDGNTPLHLAVFHHDSLSCVRYLLEHGASSNIKNHDDHTPVDLAWNCRERFWERDEARALVELLAEFGAELGLNPAVFINRVDTVRSLLEKDPDAVQHCLHPDRLVNDALLASDDPLPLVRLLLDHGADPDSYAVFYDPPLMTVCLAKHIPLAGRLRLAALLIEKGADVNAVDSQVNRNIMTAVREDGAERELIDLLISAGAEEWKLPRSE